MISGAQYRHLAYFDEGKIDIRRRDRRCFKLLFGVSSLVIAGSAHNRPFLMLKKYSHWINNSDEKGEGFSERARLGHSLINYFKKKNC